MRTSRQTTGLITSAFMVAFALTAHAAAPVAGLSSDSPGLNAVYPFVGPDEFGNTYFGYPTDWGGVITGTGVLQSGDGRLTNDADNGFIRYNTTMKGENPAAGQYTVTAMNPAEDWVLSMQWESNMTATAGTVFELSWVLGDIARLRANGAGYYELQAGNGASGYAVVEAFSPLTVLFPNTVHTLTLHYKASSQLMDFYIDGNLETENFPGRGISPQYSADFLQLGGGRTFDSGNPVPVDFFDNVKIGIISTGVDGDYNGDGSVDAADYVAWRKTPDDFGGDPAGYNLWQANFGEPGGGASAMTGLPVPEPMMLIQSVVAALTISIANATSLVRRRGILN